MLVGWSAPVSAQIAPNIESIDPSFLEQSRRVEGDSLTICTNKDSVLQEFDRAVAEAVSTALLLQPTFHVLTSPFDPLPFDFQLPLTEAKLFVEMTNTCDAIMGFRLVPSRLPEWMTVSRPYYASRSVIATADPQWKSLDDLPDTARLGARLGGPGDRAFVAYLKAQPEPGLPSRAGYANNGSLLRGLVAGELDAVLIWEPALAFASGVLGDAPINTFAPPFDSGTVEFGVAFRSQDTFLRTAFDQAISALEADGTIGGLLDRFGLPKDAQ